MNTQLKIYDLLKEGNKLSRKDIKITLNTSIQNAGLIFNKVVKLERVSKILVEEVHNGHHFLVEYLVYNI